MVESSTVDDTTPEDEDDVEESLCSGATGVLASTFTDSDTVDLRILFKAWSIWHSFYNVPNLALLK